MALARRRITGSGSLKALAHPLRLALLEVLVTQGPRTASQAAAIVGDTASNCSWHLRKLADHGFVREAPRTGGRSRPWRAVTEGLTWDADEAAATSVAGDALADLLLERELQRYRAARSQRSQETAPWRDATGLHQSQLWLTADEARRVSELVVEVFRSNAERLRDPDKRPEAARLVSMVSWLVPSGPPTGPPTPTGAPRK